MKSNIELGQLGENLACEYLVKKGYKIIERNFRQKWGELDIIAKVPNKTLVFVEVKTLRQSSGQAPEEQLSPEDQLTCSKLQKLKRTASLYAGHRQELIKDEKGWRIDLITLTLREISGSTLNESNGLTIKEECCDIKHYENIA